MSDLVLAMFGAGFITMGSAVLVLFRLERRCMAQSAALRSAVGVIIQFEQREEVKSVLRSALDGTDHDADLRQVLTTGKRGRGR